MLLKNKYIYILYCILLSSMTSLLYGQQIDYIPFKTSSQVTPQTINLSPDYYVGSIDGRAGSSGTGTATYSIPIDIPDGTANVQPSLNLTYSSGSIAKSFLGRGWNLTGLSSISRTSKTIFHDGDLGAVRFNKDDRFAIDGTRLYPLAENSADGTTYKAENENQSLITSHGNINHSPDHFTVETKDGITHVYGGEANAKILDHDGTPLIWYLSASYDKFGNHVRYFYEEVNNEHRIHSIYYNGIDTDPRTKIKFIYKERADKNFGFTNLKQSSKNSLLEKIEVYYGENIYNNPNWSNLKSHTYEFKYSNDNQDSYLTEIHKISGDGQLKYNPTVFYYGKFNQAPLVTESTYDLTSVQYSNHQDYLVGDFNGDGLSDIAKLEVQDGNWTTPSGFPIQGRIRYGGFKVALNNGDGNSFTELSRVGFKNYGNLPYHVQHLSANNRIIFRTGDFDGDGKQEILAAEFDSHHSPNKIYSYSIFDIENNTVTETAHSFAITGEPYAKLNENFTLPGNQETRHQYIFNNALVTGDFDGDQSTDIIFNYHYENDTKNRSWLHNPRKAYVRELKTDNQYGVPDYLIFKQDSRPPSLMSYDVDKDGDAELVAIYDSVEVPLITNNIELTMTGNGQNNIITYSHPQTFVSVHNIEENLHEPTSLVSQGTIIFNSAYPSYYLTVYNDPQHQMNTFELFVSTLIDVFAAPVINLSNDISPDHPQLNTIEGLEYIDNHIFNAEPYHGLSNLRCADFNGDGIMDIKFEGRGAGNQHYIVYGATTNIDFDEAYRGDIWFTDITELDFGITPANEHEHRILPFDYNSDGLTDFLEFDLSGTGDSRMTLHYNKGNGEFGQDVHINSSWNRGYVQVNPIGMNWNIYPGHFNRDSKLDLLFDLPINHSIGYDYSDNEHLIFIKKKPELENDLHRLVTVRNGLGEVTHFDYKMMSDPGIYTKGTGQQYPFSDFQGNTPLLSAIRKDNGIGTYISTEFKYEGATVHRLGRGYLGYDKVETFSSDLNTKQISTSQLLAGPIVKVPDITEVYNTAGSADVLISRSETNYQIPTYNQSLYAYSNQNHKSFRYNIKSSISANYLEGGVNKTEYTFDDYDNVLSSTSTIYNKGTFTGSFGLNSSDLIQTSTVTNTYGQYNTWIPSSLTQSTETIHYNGGLTSSNTSVTTKYTYHGNGLPRYTYHYHGSPKMYYDYFTYYPNGLLKTSKVSGGGMVKNLTTYEYDSFQRVEKVINAEGHESINTYYDSGASGGQVKSTKLPSGLTAQMFYNSFGIPYRQIDERGNSSFNRTSWITDPTLSTNLNAVYQIETEKDGLPTQTILLDRLGRTVRTKTSGFNNNEILVDREYNEKGQKRRQSEPYHIGQNLPIHFTAFYYDDFNRGIQSVRFATSNGSDPYSYLKATTTLALPAPAPNATHRSTSVTRPDGRIKTTYTDFTGRVLEVIENGTSVKNRYYISGRLAATNIFTPNMSTGGDYDQNMISYEYDIQGNLIKKKDNSIGEEIYTYNDYSELIGETNASGENTHYTYDLLGRPTSQIKPEGHTVYEYWSSSDVTPVGSMKPGLGMLKSSVLSVGGNPKHTVYYDYNTFSEVDQITEKFDDETPVVKKYTYNSNGDISKKVYQTGFTLVYEYQPETGYLQRVLSPSVTPGINAELLKIEEKDAYGHITRYKRGGNSALTTYNTYNERGYLINNKVGVVQDINYNFNHQSGNLRGKEDVRASKVERYFYDAFDRLKSTQVSTAFTEVYPDGSYMNFGSNEPQIDIDFHESENLNINSKSQVAQSITYDGSAVNQIETVTTASGVPSDLQLGNIIENKNTSFHKPRLLKMDVNGMVHEVNFEFGVDQDRKRAMIKEDNALTQKRLYYDEYEELYTYAPNGSIEDVYKIHNVGIGNGLEFIYTTKNDQTDGWNNMFFTITDYQGSVLKVTDRSGNIVDNLDYNYDAWGRRRDKSTWTYDGSSNEAVPTGGVDANGNHWAVEDYDNPGETIAPPLPTVTSTIGTSWFNRGYTGHEHYDDFQMIHMNARLYNPFLGTFLSPDRVIADPSNSQNYNRYSYALGNPVKYTDPSGYSPIGGFGGSGSGAFSGGFSGGGFGGITFGGDIGLGGINSQNLGNQYNNVGGEGDPKKKHGIHVMLDEVVLEVEGFGKSNASSGQIGTPYFEYDFNGVESPYKGLRNGLELYNYANGTNFTSHSDAMMWHHQTYYVDPAQEALNNRITNTTGDAAEIFYYGFSFAVGFEVLAIRGIGLLYNMYKTTKVVRMTRVGLKLKYAKLRNTISLSRRTAGLSSHCFIAGTKVHTELGLKSIEDIQTGDKVWSFNEDTGDKELQNVVNIQNNSTDHLIRIYVENDTINTTNEHPFFRNGEWVKAGELETGDTLRNLAGGDIIIDHIEFLQDSVEVYNFEVEGTHNYYVGNQGVLVHNKAVIAKRIPKFRVLSLRLQYMGRTPGKASATGRKVISRMKSEGMIRKRFGQTQFKAGDGEWYNLYKADMAHKIDAVTWWNSTGRYFGAKAKDVRKFMLDADNYYLELNSINRSEGALLGKTEKYLPPLK